MQVPKPWYRSYVTAKAAMQQDLFGTNPTMAAVLDLWYKTFGWVKKVKINPLNTKIKIWNLICCSYSFPTDVVGRSW